MREKAKHERTQVTHDAALPISTEAASQGLSQSESVTLAVGTYTEQMPHVDGKGKGIYLLRFTPATGHLEEIAVATAINPSYLAVSADRRRLYAVREVEAQDGPGIATYSLDAGKGTLALLSDLPTPGGCPCHVSVDDDLSMLLVSNYVGGEVLAYALNDARIPSGDPIILRREGTGPNAARQEGPHAHCALVSPDRRHVYLSDLGVDGVVRHALTDGETESPVHANADLMLVAEPGAGPRHLVFTREAHHLLINYELSSTIRMYELRNGEASLVSEISTLPVDFDGVSSAGGIRLHPSGKYVYVGNRGHDSIFVARVHENGVHGGAGRLTPIGTWPVGGRTPRDLAVSPDGRYLLAAAQDDAAIHLFTIDEDNGALTAIGQPYPIPSAACLLFF